MAKIICITSGLRGIMNASFELVHRLKAAGHEVIYAAPRSIAESVQLQGIAFFQLPRIINYKDAKLPVYKGFLGKVKNLAFKLSHMKRRRQEAYQQLFPQAFIELLEKEKPNLIIVDIELHEYIITAFGKQIPVLLLSQWFSIWKNPGLPYMLRDTIPGVSSKGSNFNIKLDWFFINVKRKLTFTKKKWRSGFTNRRTVLLDLAKATNFPLAYISENYWPGPFLYDQLPVISMTAKELEFPHKLRDNLSYVGPMVNEQRIDEKSIATQQLQLQKVFDYKKEKEAALIYCSVSTLSKGDVNFLQKVIDAIKNRKEWMLVIGLGGLVDQKDLNSCADNIFVFNDVPQLKILQEADCSVNHGGIHTINECIHFKVPMLVYSGKQSDQNGCAARIHYHQLGIMADKDLDEVPDISSKIAQVLHDKTYKLRLQELYAHYERYKSGQVLEQTIHSLLSTEQFEKKKQKI